MKTSKPADELKTLIRKLLKDAKVPDRPAIDALHALVRGILSYDAPDARVDDAMAVVAREFCDLNELRVATDLEIQDLISSKYPDIERRSQALIASLNHIFEKEHTLSLERLKTLGKKEARQAVRDLPEVNTFVEAYVCVVCYDVAAIPVDEETVAYLVEQGALEADTSPEETQKLLENAVKAEECWDLYTALRRVTGERLTRRAAKAARA